MDLEKTCRILAKQLNEDPGTVHQIVMYEWLFTRRVMQDPDDTRDILFNKLFKFKLKPRFKTNKTKNYSPNDKANSSSKE